MVTVNRSNKSTGSNKLTAIAALVVTIVALAGWYNDVVHSVADLRTLTALSESLQFASVAFDADQNAAEIKAWRKSIHYSCSQAKTVEDVEAISKMNKDIFVLPSLVSPQPRDERSVKRCKNIVLDFGANIGDTSGKVIDGGLPGCERKDLKREVSGAVFNTEARQLQDPKNNRRNPLVSQFTHLMQSFSPSTGPEDYCYYGVEGNPVFTERLQSLEDFIMAVRPRPLQHVHFFTESVGASKDGMTKLYLDTVNKEQNYWGSSIFQGHQDVRKSAEFQNTTEDKAAAADVMGYTIGALMRNILTAFEPYATPEDKTGGHFILKVDIEGGEYPLVAQAAEEGTLCEYVKMGNQADLYIEFHSQRVTGKNPLAGKMKDYQKKLTDCGVNFRQLQAWWA